MERRERERERALPRPASVADEAWLARRDVREEGGETRVPRDSSKAHPRDGHGEPHPARRGLPRHRTGGSR